MAKKLPVQSPKYTTETLEKLRQIVPSAFCDGELQLDLLMEALGEFAEDKTERYEFTWHGKAAAKRAGHPGTSATLHPCPEESKNWDTTQNLYIEGDNLEVLKCLSNAYSGKIKMIYIDPPYNTGHDFVYKDNYKDPLKAYAEQTGQVDEDGRALTTNKETDGRYHTNWLNMMYPRLMLAQRLLTDDGVIFISIDDNEQANLKKMCDEVFGADNFVANLVWKHTEQSKNDELYFSRQYNHNLVFVKNKEIVKPFFLERTEDNNVNYRNPDDDPKGAWRSGDVRSPNYRKTLCYDIIAPDGTIIKSPKNGWRWSQESLNEKISTGEIIFKKDNSGIVRKIYLCEQEGRTPENLWAEAKYGTTRLATAMIKSLFNNIQIFDTPKPIELITNMLELIRDKNAIVLDFFSGSATTAHAVMQMNSTDGGMRKYIMVQLPEDLDKSYKDASNDKKIILKNSIDLCDSLTCPHKLSEIGKERIRRAGDKVVSDQLASGKGTDNCQLTTNHLDIGFKVFKLGASNMKDWELSDKPLDAQNDIEQQLVRALETAPATIKPGADKLSVAYEWLLKRGFMLDTKLDVKTVCGKTVYVNATGEIMICLEDGLSIEWAQALADLHKSYEDAEMWDVIVSWNGFGSDEKTRDANLRNVEQCLVANGLNADRLTIV